MNKYVFTLLLSAGERTVELETSLGREAADEKIKRDYGIGCSGILCCEEDPGNVEPTDTEATT